MLSPEPVTSKANHPELPAARLCGHTLASFEGTDAGAFLQAQLMNDVRLLQPGQWHWTGWLNPKGRVIALFALLRTGESSFLAILPDFPAAELLSRLQRYVFRSKVRMATVTDLACVAVLADGSPASGARDAARLENGAWRLDMSGDDDVRLLLLLPENAAPREDAAVAEAWLARDLAHGLPRLPMAQSEAWTPQMLSLERLAAFSLKKGCYPGQEIVARTRYLGKARRGLRRVAGVGLQPGQPLRAPDGSEFGRIACVASDGAQALAVVQLDHAELVQMNDENLSFLLLLPGLARPA